jgi:acyl carrier protein
VERIDLHKPLLQLGIDSLMAVELRNWLEGELRLDVPIVELMKSPSLAGLAALLAERLATLDQAPADQAGCGGAVNGPADIDGVSGALPSHIAPTELLARIDELSSEELDAALSALLDERDHILEPTAGRTGVP